MRMEAFVASHQLLDLVIRHYLSLTPITPLSPPVIRPRSLQLATWL